MPQFDVYVNPQPASRQSVPYVLDIQNALIDQLPTRLVMPISRLGSHLDKGQVKLPRNSFHIRDRLVVLGQRSQILTSCPDQRALRI